MLARIPYETAEERGTYLEFEIPDKNVLKSFLPRESRGIEELWRDVDHAVNLPIDGKSFRQLVDRGKKVVFVTENQFRAAPAELILPSLIERAEAEGAEVSIVIANGKVPALSPDEIRKRIGFQVADKGVPVTCNDATNLERYSFVGVTSAGTPVWVLKEVMEADVVITISTTQATLWGYGGSGMVIPGVSANDTIETNHVMSLSPDCKPGNNDCAMQKDKYEALKMAGIDMGINVIVNNAWEVVYVNAGDPVASHKKAVEHYDKTYRFDIGGMKERADIVITGSSAPTDHLFFHTNWAIVNCAPVAKEGATIIQATPCPGYGDWPGFALMDLMTDYMPPTDANHERALRAFFARERELWAGCIWYPLYRTMLNHRVKVVTRPENIDMARGVGIDATTGLEDAIKEAMELHGPDAKVAVVPYGRYTVFTE